MREICPDLWETRPESPFTGLTTHAYLWTPPTGNVLFYSTVSDADHDEIDRLGGIAHHYLSHRDEAGPMLAAVGERFGASLHVSQLEAADAARFRQPDVPFAAERHVTPEGIEVIPSPGHTPGSTCYVVPGHSGATYLFTGDTIFLGTDDRWHAGLLPFSDHEQLVETLRLLADLTPDLVVSSAAPTGRGAHEPRRTWRDCVEEALSGIGRLN